MSATSIYGEHREAMEDVLAYVLQKLYGYRESIKTETGIDPVDHVLSRIKTEESMREKCRLHGLPETEETALEVIHDAIGLRVVCPFLNDVYDMAARIEADPDLPNDEKRDYILQAKENGYRSLHLIVKVGRYYVEIQLRTVSQDTWAALDHQIKSKKSVRDPALMVRELKRGADELASTDMSMQTIRDMIREESDD